MSTTQQPEALAELRERLRSLEKDHTPNGWPAVRMREITGLLDCIAALETDSATLRTGYAAARLEIDSLRARLAGDGFQSDEWLQDRGLLYRLTDERHPCNRDEINVTMADGSRSLEDRTRRAGELLDCIRATRATHPENFDHGPQATSTEEAALDLRHVAMLCAHTQPEGAQQPGAAYAALFDALSQHDDPCDDFAEAVQRVRALRAEVERLTRAESARVDALALRASHGQAPAQAASQDFTRTHHRLMGDAMKSRLENGSHEAMMDSYAQAAPAAVAGPSEQQVFEEWLSRVHPSGDAEAVQAQWKRSGDYLEWLGAAPTTQPAPANATAPSYDTLQLYKDLQDLWAEANAVDTVIGRPEVLMAKITKMRDAVGQMTGTYLPAPQQEAQERVYLVATGETRNGLELYERHDKFVPFADCEVLYTAPQPAPVDGKLGWHAFPAHLQHPDGRALRTAADLLKRYGYTGLAAQFRQMADVLLGAPPGEPTSISQAARDVLAERQRQISAEGWTPEHDDEHVNDEIAAMACYYVMPPGAREWSGPDGYGDTLGDAIRPDGWDAKDCDRRRELVKGAALALAELERIDRADTARTQQEGRIHA